jgi:hypothetical protein|tara:strand:- start:123 stop:380 length:258 start_codon:yes stop_codon:yes gene_type:complete
MSSITFFYGAADGAFSFTRGELSIIERALGELLSYEEDWVNDDRSSVVKHAEEQIEKCHLLLAKINHYRNEILKYLEQEVEDDEE